MRASDRAAASPALPPTGTTFSPLTILLFPFILLVEKSSHSVAMVYSCCPKVGSAYSAILIDSLNALPHGVKRLLQASRTRFLTLSGKRMLNSSAWNPPTEPPVRRSIFSMPRCSSRRLWQCATSLTVVSGKSSIYGFPVTGLIEHGEVLP